MDHAQITEYLHNVLLVLGHQRVASKLSKDFRNVTIHSKPKEISIRDDGSYELYPKVWFEGEVKGNSNVVDALAEVVNDADAAFTAQLNSDGFIIVEKEVHY